MSALLHAPPGAVAGPLRARHRDAYLRFCERLSAETKRRRFGGPKPRLSEREVAFFLSAGSPGHEAVAAWDADGEIVGVARAVEDGGSGVLDLGIVVDDDWQGCGVGPLMLDELEGRLRRAGARRVVAETEPENGPAIALLTRRGYDPAGWARGVRRFALDLRR